MQSETGFPSSHQLKSYVASKSRLKLAARAVLSADAGLLVCTAHTFTQPPEILCVTMLFSRPDTPISAPSYGASTLLSEHNFQFSVALT